MYKKILIITLSLTLLVLVAVAGTLTWLQVQTQTITNTFVAGDIKLELKENTGNEYKMVPGAEIAKDPRVIVKAGSEKCYIFVKLEKSGDFDAFLTYTVADGWTVLDEIKYPNIYYRTAPSSDTDQEFYIIAGNVVTTKSEATKEQFNALTAETQPKLIVTAYAVQQEVMGSALDAWKATFGKDATPETTTPETTTPETTTPETTTPHA